MGLVAALQVFNHWLIGGTGLAAGSAMAWRVSGVGAALIGIALLAFRSKIEPRDRKQDRDEYWDTGRTRQRALMMWFLLEGAALLSSMGYFLTGSLAALAVMVAALVLLALMPPAAQEEA